jgi:hypothetical protein
MPKKEWTEAERKAFGDKMKLAREKKEQEVPIQEYPELLKDEIPVKTDVQETSLADLQRQMNEVMETNALLKAALLRGTVPAPQGGMQIGRQGTLIGEIDKYLVDPDNYPDPTRRLAKESRLETIAFNHNYELTYEFRVRSYETKTGVNMREPEFLITLLRVVMDDQGNRVKVKVGDEIRDKFYIARRLMFHEDPQAAMVIARENNILIDAEDEKTFLDEMRYLRIRDWLFDFFWPKKPVQKDGIQEEAIGGTIVEIFTKSSLDPSHIDFDQIRNKM